jgi:hypothetical protein
MKFLEKIIIILALIGCQPAREFDYYSFEQHDVFPVSAELQMVDDGTFLITVLDYHAHFGEHQRGEFRWENNILILEYESSKIHYLILEANKLYRIVEYDSIIANNIRFNSNTEVIEIVNNEFLIPFSKPARSNFELWTKGRIEDFDQQVNYFKTTQDNYFEE